MACGFNVTTVMSCPASVLIRMLKPCAAKRTISKTSLDHRMSLCMGYPAWDFWRVFVFWQDSQGWSLERPLQPDSRAMRQAAKVKERKLSAGLGDRRLGPWLLHIAVQHNRNLPYLMHQLVKLIGEDRLHPVRQRVIRI